MKYKLKLQGVEGLIEFTATKETRCKEAIRIAIEYGTAIEGIYNEDGYKIYNGLEIAQISLVNVMAVICLGILLLTGIIYVLK